MTSEYRFRPAALAAGLFFLCMALWLGTPRTALARAVTVTWTEGAANATVHDRSGAVQSAFRTAVFQEALDILPGAIDDARQSLLWDFLAPKAGNWVQSYSETSHSQEAAVPADGDQQAQTGPVRTLGLDVMVNRSAVKSALRRAGIYYTTASTRPFELHLSGDTGAAWSRLGDLQRLSGLTVQEGARPVLTLSMQAPKGQGQDPVWSGTLVDGDQTWTAWGPDLSVVWFDLWGKYFSRPEVESGVLRSVNLVMDGWFTPDGVRSFDTVLRGWQDEVEEATLVGVTATAEGVEAHWRVKTLNPQALEQRLAGYAPDRGLQWRLAQ